MPAPTPAILNGAELVRRLKEHGTGETKLAVARKVLADIHRTEHRVASAAEVIDALTAAAAGEGTLLKARVLVETGTWSGPPKAEDVPIEDELLGPPPVPAPAPEPAPAPAADTKPLLDRIRELEERLAAATAPRDNGDDGYESAPADDLESMTVVQLKAMAAERNVPLPDGAKKADIVAALRAA